MKHSVLSTVLKFCVESLFIAIGVALIVLLIGYLNKWGDPIKYSNAFFIAGCLLIIAGTSTGRRLVRSGACTSA
jgi:hypothetical protein